MRCTMNAAAAAAAASCELLDVQLKHDRELAGRSLIDRRLPGARAKSDPPNADAAVRRHGQHAARYYSRHDHLEGVNAPGVTWVWNRSK